MPVLPMPAPTTTTTPTFDRARLTPEGFVRDPKGDVLIIPGDRSIDDVPEWAAFVREYNLSDGRAVIQARLKDGYSVFTRFDKNGAWGDTRGVPGTAPSIRLARFHAFQALAQRVLEDDPTNVDAAATLVSAGRAIARGDREPTFAEFTTDLCLMTAAMNTAEAAKKAGEKVSVTADKTARDAAKGVPTVDSPVFDRWFRYKRTDAGKALRRHESFDPFAEKGVWAVAERAGAWRVFRDDKVVQRGQAADFPTALLEAERAYIAETEGALPALPVPTPAPVPPVEKAPEVQAIPEVTPWTPGDTRLFDRWLAGSPNLGIVAYKNSGEFKNLSAYAYAGKWGVYVGSEPNIEGNAGSFEQNLIAAEQAYRTTLALKRLSTGQDNIEVQIVPDGEARPVGQWYIWCDGAGSRFKVYADDNADELWASASAGSWRVSADYKTLAKGNAGSLEANTRAAERLYQHYAAEKDAAKKAAQAPPPPAPPPPEVVTIDMFADRPVGQWYQRGGPGGISWIFENPGEPGGARGFSADVSDVSWYVRENDVTVVRGCEGSYEKNLIAADKAYRNLLAAKAAAEKKPAPTPPPAPAKDRYNIRPNTVDVYTTPTHIAIGQVWRTQAGDTAMVSAVTAFEDNYAADNKSDLLNLEYDKTGRITDYGGCTYAGYVPVVWLDKVPSGG